MEDRKDPLGILSNTESKSDPLGILGEEVVKKKEPTTQDSTTPLSPSALGLREPGSEVETDLSGSEMLKPNVPAGERSEKPLSFTNLTEKKRQQLESISAKNKAGIVNPDLQDIRPSEDGLTLDDYTDRTKVLRGLLTESKDLQSQWENGVKSAKDRYDFYNNQYQQQPTFQNKRELEQSIQDLKNTERDYNKRAFITNVYERRLLQTSDSIKKLANENVPKGFFEGVYTGLKGNIDSWDSSIELAKLSKQEQIDYAKKQAEIAPTKEVGRLAEFGEMVGGVVPDIATAIGFSLVGLPYVGAATVAARQGAQQAAEDFSRAFNEAKQGLRTGQFDARGKEILRYPSDDEAYEIATKAAGVGFGTGALEGIVGTTTGGLSTKIASRASTPLKKMLTEKLVDTGADALIAGTMQTGRNVYDRVQGLDTKITEGVAKNMIGEVLLGVPINAVTGYREYKGEVKNNAKKAIYEAVEKSKLEPEELIKLKQNIEVLKNQGAITNNDYIEMNKRVDGYAKAIDSMPEDVQKRKDSQEIAELIVQRDDLTKQKEKTDEALKEGVDEKINAINSRIKEIVSTPPVEEVSPEVVLQKYTTPTDEKYGYIDRGDGKGKVELTKEEFINQQKQQYATQEIKQQEGVSGEPESGIKGGKAEETGLGDSVQRTAEGAEKEEVTKSEEQLLNKKYEKATKEEDGKPMPERVSGVRIEGEGGKESAELRSEEEEVKPTPQKIKVLGKDVNMYNDYIPSKEEDVETDAMYTFSANSKDGIPTLLQDVAYSNKKEVNGVKIENWYASISGDELIKLYPKKEVTEQEITTTEGKPKEVAPQVGDISKEDENYRQSRAVTEAVSKENPEASILITPKGNDLNLTAVYVGKEKRGKGIGSKVLESVKRQADKLGKKVVLDATNELDEETDLERLGNFYEKNGFVKVGENKFEYNPKATPQAGSVVGGEKSILNSDTDLKGNKKDEFMLPVTYTQSKRVGDIVQFVNSQGEQMTGNYRGTNTEGKAIIDRPQSKDGKKYNLTSVVPESDVTFPLYEDTGIDKGSSDAIKYAIENDLYTNAILNGRMTATDAVKIIESAGLEVPKDIAEQSLQATPQASSVVGGEMVKIEEEPLTNEEEKLAEEIKITKEDAKRTKKTSPKRTRKSKDIARIVESETKIAEDTKDAGRAKGLIETIESAEESILSNEPVDETFEQKHGVSEIAIVNELKEMGKQGDFYTAYQNLTGKEANIEAEIDFLSSVSAQGIKVRPKLSVEFTEENHIVETKPLKKKPTKKTGIDSLQNIVSDDLTRPAMNGVYFDGNNMVATDAHKLIVLPKKESDAYIIEKLIDSNYKKTKKTVPTYTREQATNYIKEQLKGGLNGKILDFNKGMVVDAVYPKYKEVIPDYKKGVKVDLQELIDILNGARSVQENLSNNVFGISVKLGGEVSVFNPSLFMDLALSMQENGAKTIEILNEGDPKKATLLKSDNGITGLMMPLAAKNEFPVSQVYDLSTKLAEAKLAEAKLAEAKLAEAKLAEAKPTKKAKLAEKPKPAAEPKEPSEPQKPAGAEVKGEPKETTDFGKAISASSRFRPYETVIFDKPIIGKNGNKLISYQWAYEWTMLPNWEGELKSKRVSDWTQAESSAETGRDIVHKFTVERTDGVIVTVSSETIPSLLGYVDAKEMKNFPSIVSSVKTLAKQRMQLAILKAQEAEYNAIKKEVNDLPKPKIVPAEIIDLPKAVQSIVLRDSSFLDEVKYWKTEGEIKVVYRQENKSNTPDNRTKEQLLGLWESAEIERRGGKKPQGLYDLERRIERQEKKVEQATGSKLKAVEQLIGKPKEATPQIVSDDLVNFLKGDKGGLMQPDTDAMVKQFVEMKRKQGIDDNELRKGLEDAADKGIIPKEKIDEYMGVEPKVSPERESARQVIKDVIDNYYQTKEGKLTSSEKQKARMKMSDMMAKNPSIKYIFDKLTNIHKQLEMMPTGEFKKTKNCP